MHCAGVPWSNVHPINPANIAVLVKGGADIEARDNGDIGNLTALHYAAAVSENPAVIAALVAAGADIEAAQGPTGFRPLHLAALTNHARPVIEALMAAGADTGARGGNVRAGETGVTPLHVAVYARNVDAIAVLRTRADVDARVFR